MIINVPLLEHGPDPEPLLGAGLTLDVVVVPVLARRDALLGAVVLNTLHCLQLEISANSGLKSEINLYTVHTQCSPPNPILTCADMT